MWTGRTKQVSIVLFIVGVSALALGASGAPGKRFQNVGIDVACDANSFVFQGPSTPDGPAYGASFVVQGVIYPGGTFDEHGVDSGLLADGQPEFPDAVIGEWTCRGWFIGDGLPTKTGPFVVTTQIYDVDDEHFGTGTVVSDGKELIDLDVPFARAITGATGDYSRRFSRGQLFQTGIGVNKTGLFNFTFRRKP